MTPAPGVLLVAAPAMDDPNFQRSVVWLAEHNDDGTLGFIVNRPIRSTLAELWEGCPAALGRLVCAAEGGPVERHKGLLVHGRCDLPAAAPLAAGVCVGGDLQALAEHWQHGTDSTGPRLFLGHSGWAPGQLIAEIAAGGWILRPGRLAHVLTVPSDGDGLWRSLCRSAPATLDPSPN